MACRNPTARALSQLSYSSLCERKGAPDAGEPGLSLAVDQESARLVRLSAPPCHGEQEQSAIEQGRAGPPDATDGAAQHEAGCLRDSGLHPSTIARVPPHPASFRRVRWCGWEHE